jgi:hypothetical protein
LLCPYLGPKRCKNRKMSNSHEPSNFIRAIAGLLHGPDQINVNLHFYRVTPPRSWEEIDADPERAEDEILRRLREVTA